MKKEFPERHDWRMEDNITASAIGEKISDCISADLLGERNFVPGLRMALNILLEYLEEKNHA
jgi:hypothetical protein